MRRVAGGARLLVALRGVFFLVLYIGDFVYVSRRVKMSGSPNVLIDRAQVCHDDWFGFGGGVVCEAIFCYPCVMGSALEMAQAKAGTAKTGLFPPCGSNGFLVCTSAFCCGGAVPFWVGLCLRTATVTVDKDQKRHKTFRNLGNQIKNENQSYCTICLSSAFPICSCAPCQFNKYRRGEDLQPDLGMMWV